MVRGWARATSRRSPTRDPPTLPQGDRVESTAGALDWQERLLRPRSRLRGVVTRRAGAVAVALVLVGALGSCAIGSSQGAQATLKPTLELRHVDGGTVAFQSGQPVPDFGLQPRPRLDLDGAWRFQADSQLDDNLTFGDRSQTLRTLTL